LAVRALIMSLVILAGLAGCATAPVKSPEVQAQIADANNALDTLNVQTAQFYDGLQKVLKEIKDLQGQPGWTDLEQIIAGTPSLKSLEDDFEKEPDTMSLLEAWSQKWNDCWRPLFYEYARLADQCTILEARRLALRERLFVVQAKFIGATLKTESSSYKEAVSLFSVVDILGRSETELNSFTTNEIGLYDPKLHN
jgi:hypothetical protein